MGHLSLMQRVLRSEMSRLVDTVYILASEASLLSYFRKAKLDGLWMWKLNIGSGSGEANLAQSFGKNATGGSLAYHTKSIKRTNTYSFRSISSPDVRIFFYCQPTVKRHKLSWFGHVCRHDTLPKIILQVIMDGIVVAEKDRVNHRMTTLRNGQACRYHRHCCASRRT